MTQLLRMNSVRTISRFCSTNQLVFSEFGDPTKVISLKNVALDEVGDSEVSVKYLASPINPADINMIQGVYPLKPKFPAVGGNEGVAVVEKVGCCVSNLKAGDWIIPMRPMCGTWQTRAIYEQNDVMKIANDIAIATASCLMVNPPTAYRMLMDFQNLKPGDCVIQNGANSGVGIAVIQIARSMAVKTINIVRNRDDIQNLKDQLSSFGADYVFTEEEMRTNEAKSTIKSLCPSVAFNCVGGKSGIALAASLAPKGKLITYGAMSKQPLQVPTGPLIFNFIELHGFWMSHWYTIKENQPEKRNMFEKLTDLIRNNQLSPPPFEFVNLDEYEKAIQIATSGTGLKQILKFDEFKAKI